MASPDLAAASPATAPPLTLEEMQDALKNAAAAAEKGDKQAGIEANRLADLIHARQQQSSVFRPGGPEPRKLPEKTLAGDTWGGLASDIGKTIISKPLEGIVKTPGIAGDLGSLAKLGRDYAVTKFSDTPWEEQRKQPFLGMSQETLDRYGSEAFKKSAEETTGIKFHEPETRVGQVLGGGLEFAGGALVPIPGASGVKAATKGAETALEATKLGARAIGKDAFRYGGLPGSLAELAGIATEGSTYEPWARGAVALGAGGTAALASSRTKLEKELLAGMSEAQLQQTEELFRTSLKSGTPLTRAEAAQFITHGGTNLADLQRWVEGTGNQRMKAFMAARGGGVKSAQEEIFGRILGPKTDETSLIGPAVRDAAAGVIADTPQARSVGRAEASIPPLSPERSGNVIQPELLQTRQGLEGARSAEAGVNYPAAYNQPSGAALGAAQTTPRMVPVTAVESLAKGVDEAQVLAKGAPLAALEKAAGIIRRPDGSLEMSVEGLHQSRIALGDAIGEATRVGNDAAAARLMQVKNELDAQLKAIPEFAAADAAFQRSSVPLKPFEAEGGPLGAPTDIVKLTGDPKMPPSQVPGAIARSGPEGVQALVDTMTPGSRSVQEMGDFLAAQIVQDSKGDPAAIRAALTSKANVDTLKRFPDAVARLEGLAAAREALEQTITRGPLAALLKNKNPATVEAVNSLLGNPNISAEEMNRTMTALAGKNRQAAADLLRFHLDNEFAKARDLSRTSSHAGQVSGPAWAQAVAGNEQTKARLTAAIEAVHGRDAAKGIGDFINVLTAMGERQGVGSRTSFNLQYAKDLEAGGVITAGAKAFLDSPTKLGLMKGVKDKWDNWTRSGNEEKIARLLTDPDAAAQFRALAQGGGSGARATRALTNLTYMMDRITREEEGGQPLRFTVKARREPAQ